MCEFTFDAETKTFTSVKHEDILNAKEPYMLYFQITGHACIPHTILLKLKGLIFFFPVFFTSSNVLNWQDEAYRNEHLQLYFACTVVVVWLCGY